MKISVIIPTYNEEDVILTCLESLSKQSNTDLEVIVVDDGSRDKSKIKIQKAKKTASLRGQFKNQKLTLLEQNHKGAGAARNLGAKSAKGEILVFVDSDMTFDQDFIRNLTSPIIDGISRGTFSKEEHVSNWNNIWSRCWNINEGWQSKMRHPKNYPDHQPVFRAILKSEFDKVGGFTPGGYDDDWSLSKKLGYEAVVAPHAIFFHKNPGNLKEVYNHAKWVGKRSYKLGAIGYMVALLRSSFPVSLIMGILRSTSHLLPAFVIFKIVYDFGVFVGILNFIFTKKGSK